MYIHPGPRGRPEPKTLLPFLQALPGKRVKLELQNDTLVEGTVESVSETSDFALLDVRIQPLQGVPEETVWMWVKSSQVRCVMMGDLNLQHIVKGFRESGLGSRLLMKREVARKEPGHIQGIRMLGRDTADGREEAAQP